MLGASGGIGQPLSLLLKNSPLVSRLTLYDIAHTPGVAADLSHIETRATVKGTGLTDPMDRSSRLPSSPGSSFRVRFLGGTRCLETWGFCVHFRIKFYKLLQLFGLVSKNASSVFQKNNSGLMFPFKNFYNLK